MFSIEFAVASICEAYSLGKSRIAPEKIYHGLLHDVWRLQTEKGSYAVKIIAENQFNIHVLSPTQAEEIALLMQQNGINTVTALAPFCLKLDEVHIAVVMPWVEGHKLAIEEIYPDRVRKIGNLLGRIHLINLSYPKLRQQSFEGLEQHNWQTLIHKIPAFTFKEDLLSKLPNLIKWSHLTQQAIDRSNNQDVLSHRDFDSKNVLWLNNSPILLDWEYAGLINPSLDLLIVALNWSGIQYGFFKKENFDAVIAGFTEVAPPLEFTMKSYYLYFGYCLDWLVFCLKKFLLTNDVRYRHEVLNTYRAIELVEDIFHL